MRTFFKLFTISILSLPAALCAQQIRIQGAEQELIAGPGQPSQRPQWLDSLQRWRIHEKINYSITVTNIPE